VSKIGYDYNVKCENACDIGTFTYSESVPYEAMETVLVNEAENEHTLIELLKCDNETAKDICEKLVDIWEEEIAWLYEKEDF